MDNCTRVVARIRKPVEAEAAAAAAEDTISEWDTVFWSYPMFFHRILN